MKKVGLVLEGGAMRCLFTAGVLDVFLDNNINVDGIIGVSAGALNGVNYFSKQRGRIIRYSKKYCRDLRYMGILSYIFTGNAVNKNFAYYKVSKELDPFDNKTFIDSNKDYYAVATDILTGLPEYFKVSDCFRDLEILRASSSLPLVSKPVVINNKKYLDGAITDSIPVLKMLEMGYEKVIVILTRPKGYRKEELTDIELKHVKRRFKDYPKFVDAITNRYIMYNNTLDKIDELEKEGKLFVIRPSKPININVLERNPKKLQEIYDLGFNDANDYLEALKKYCN